MLSCPCAKELPECGHLPCETSTGYKLPVNCLLLESRTTKTTPRHCHAIQVRGSMLSRDHCFGCLFLCLSGHCKLRMAYLGGDASLQQRTPHGRGRWLRWRASLSVFLGAIVVPLGCSWLVGLLAITGTLVACGGGATGPPVPMTPTPPGTYALTVTASTGNASHNMTLTLNVK